MTLDGAAAPFIAVDAGPMGCRGLCKSPSASIEHEVSAVPLNRRHAVVFALCSAGLFFESLNCS